MTTSGSRVLVVLLCETRGWELTAPLFLKNILGTLRADLALCVADNARETSNPFFEAATFVWRQPEPDDWGELYEAESGSRDWEALLSLQDSFLGGIHHTLHPTRGSGAIIMWFRRFLSRCLRDAELLGRYDWFIITRSDFMWPTPHPPLRLLNPRFIYLLDGEAYGGVSDRYAAVPRRQMATFLTIPDPLFDEPLALRARLASDKAMNPTLRLNPERFILLRLREVGLAGAVRYLPYMPYAVRTSEGHTRWARGVYDPGRGYFIKYPTELARSTAVAAVVRDPADWATFFSPVRGAWKRWVLRVHTFTHLGRVIGARAALGLTLRGVIPVWWLPRP